MRAALYDFRRGFLRLSVLIPLALFVLAGIGVAYQGLAYLASGVGGYTAVYSYIDPERGEYKVEVLFLNRDLEPAQGAVSYKISYYEISGVSPEPGGGVVKHAEEVVVDQGVLVLKNGQGSIHKQLEAPLPSEQHMNYVLTITVSSAFGLSSSGLGYAGVEVGDNKTLYICTDVSTHNCSPYHRSSIANGSVVVDPLKAGLGVPSPWSLNEFVSLALFVKSGSEQANEIELVLLSSFFSLNRTEYEVYVLNPNTNLTELPVTIRLEELDRYFVYMGKISRGVGVLEKSIGFEGNVSRLTSETLYVLLLDRGSGEYLVLRAQPMVVIGSPVQRELVAGLILSGLGLFNAFAPVVMLYLAYVYIAKPRSQGALEFVLARPITRFELYNTRFLAGTLVAVAISAVFYVSLYTALCILLNTVPDVTVFLLLFAGSLLSLIAFYSLYYMVSSMVSGARYLVIAILLFFVFLLVFPMVFIFVALSVGVGPGLSERIIRLSMVAEYFRPNGVNAFMQYHVQEIMGILPKETLEIFHSVFNPALAALSTALWIALPYVVGWLRFRKANLSA